MTNDIIAKLKKHLRGGVRTECRVVYLLAEIRKLLEEEEQQNRQHPQPRALALWMFCHWALHVKLSNSGTTSQFLERAEAYVISQNVHGLPSPNGSFGLIQQHRFAQELLLMTNFRSQLRAFLNSKGLSTRICDRDKSWFTFLAAYAGVIEDGTLSIDKGRNPLQVIERMTFSKGHTLSKGHHIPFVIHWNVHLKDKRILQFDLKTVPGVPKGVNAFGHGFRVIPPPVALSPAPRRP